MGRIFLIMGLLIFTSLGAAAASNPPIQFFPPENCQTGVNMLLTWDNTSETRCMKMSDLFPLCVPGEVLTKTSTGFVCVGPPCLGPTQLLITSKACPVPTNGGQASGSISTYNVQNCDGTVTGPFTSNTCGCVPESVDTLAACPPGTQGNIVTTTVTDCGGNVTSTVSNQCTVGIVTTQPTTCSIGQTYSGHLNGGVFTGCAGGDLTCHTYTCTTSGLK